MRRRRARTHTPRESDSFLSLWDSLHTHRESNAEQRHSHSTDTHSFCTLSAYSSASALPMCYKLMIKIHFHPLSPLYSSGRGREQHTHASVLYRSLSPHTHIHPFFQSSSLPLIWRQHTLVSPSTHISLQLIVCVLLRIGLSFFFFSTPLLSSNNSASPAFSGGESPILPSFAPS